MQGMRVNLPNPQLQSIPTRPRGAMAAQVPVTARKSNGGKPEHPAIIRPSRPAGTAWVDMQSSRGSSRAATPTRVQVDPGNAAGRPRWNRQGSTDATPKPESADESLGVATILLKHAEAASEADATVFRATAARLLANQPVQSKPSSSSPKPMASSNGGKEVHIAKVQAITNQLQALSARAERLRASYQNQAKTALSTHEAWTKTCEEITQLEAAKSKAIAEKQQAEDQQQQSKPTQAPTLVDKWGLDMECLPASVQESIANEISMVYTKVAATIAAAKEQQRKQTSLHEGMDVDSAAGGSGDAGGDDAAKSPERRQPAAKRHRSNSRSRSPTNSFSTVPTKRSSRGSSQGWSEKQESQG